MPPIAAAETFMKARRFRYTCFGVISELRILAMEPHFGVHAHLDRPTVFSCRAESPLLEGAYGHLVGVGAERAQYPDDAWRAVLEQDDVEDDTAGGADTRRAKVHHPH